MRVNSLELFQFRNYHQFSISFDHNINILIGKNAQGKTNLIESIYLLSVCKSFRTHLNKQMITFEQEFARVKANITANKKDRTLEVIIGDNFKKAKIDQKDILKISEFVGYLNVVVFVPDDLNLIKGSPNIRRKFLDLEISKISPIYIFQLNKYYKLLKERNKYLKILNKKNKSNDPYLEVLDEQLAKIQIDIIKKRKEFIDKLSSKTNEYYQKISLDQETIKLTYKSFIKDEITTNNILDIYKNSRNRDIRYMQSHKGIHKDDINIFINNQDAFYFASQGQQRSIILAIKIALIDIIKEEIGEYPILLLDDVLSELDNYRQNKLLDLLSQNIQTFITTTSIDGIEHQLIKEANKIYIDKERTTNNG